MNRKSTQEISQEFAASCIYKARIQSLYGQAKKMFGAEHAITKALEVKFFAYDEVHHKIMVEWQQRMAQEQLESNS